MGLMSGILVLGVLVFVHELGHFLVARFFGVGVLEFAIGFGPVLGRWQGRHTTYSLRAIPLGGFVRMAGDDPVMVYGESVVGEHTAASGASPVEGTQEELSKEQQELLKDESCWFLKKSYFPRVAIVLAGPMANFLFAWALAFGSYVSNGLPTLVDGPVTIGAVQKGLPAESAGLRTGDRVVSVDGKTVTSFKDLVDLVRSSSGKSLDFVIQRSNGEVGNGQPIEAESITIPVQPVSDASPELDILEGKQPNQTFRIGVTPGMANVAYTKVGISVAAGAAVSQVVELSRQTLRVLRGLVMGDLSPQKTIGGPIEIFKQAAVSANAGWVELIGFAVYVSVMLAIMNLLPIPVLDGGHLTLFTIEQLRGRPLSMRVQAAVTNVGLVLLLSLMVYAIGNDLVRTFL